VFRGIQQTAGYYLASGGVLVLLGVLGYLHQGRFWRYLVMASLFVVELHTMVLPTFPTTLNAFLNPLLVRTGLREPYLPFQMLALLRKLAITFFIALSQLGPLLQDPNASSSDTDAVSPQQLDRLDGLARAADQEIGRLMGLELSAFVGERSHLRGLRDSVKEWLVQNTVRNDPEVNAAVNTVLARQRHEGETAIPR
jgi:hypothetical protein